MAGRKKAMRKKKPAMNQVGTRGGGFPRKEANMSATRKKPAKSKLKNKKKG